MCGEWEWPNSLSMANTVTAKPERLTVNQWKFQLPGLTISRIMHVFRLHSLQSHVFPTRLHVFTQFPIKTMCKKFRASLLVHHLSTKHSIYFLTWFFLSPATPTSTEIILSETADEQSNVCEYHFDKNYQNRFVFSIQVLGLTAEAKF